MIGLARGFSTLVGAAVAGILLWFATQVGTETAGEYWATYGLVAAAGLTMALSQLLGGWTKWGWPRFSLGVFLLGFLPVLAAGGWVLLAQQPADWMNTANWSRDLGVDGLVADLATLLPALAFAIGLTFGFSFDTAGPRVEVVEAEEDVRVVDDDRPLHDADEPLTAERTRTVPDRPRPDTATVGPIVDDDVRRDERITTTGPETDERWEDR